ncbi:PEP-CTERM sorting domain-containing protein [Thermodesulfobacteriota bacterium]
MHKLSKIFLLSMLSFFFILGNAIAGPFGTDITIYDNRSSGTGWYGTQEDQEVEPGMQTSQQWDLEAFAIQGSTLTIISGYNFLRDDWNFGDIFIDVDGDAKYGIAAPPTSTPTDTNKFGYDYVIDLDLQQDSQTLAYSVYQLDSASVLNMVYPAWNHPESSPYSYNSGGTLVTGAGGDISFLGYPTPLTDAQVGGYAGGSHYTLSVDIGWLFDPAKAPDYDDFFLAKTTMYCGNDNLIGAIPEPATMLLLGSGLIGIAAIGRKRFLKEM